MNRFATRAHFAFHGLAALTAGCVCFLVASLVRADALHAVVALTLALVAWPVGVFALLTRSVADSSAWLDRTFSVPALDALFAGMGIQRQQPGGRALGNRLLAHLGDAIAERLAILVDCGVVIVVVGGSPLHRVVEVHVPFEHPEMVQATLRDELLAMGFRFTGVTARAQRYERVPAPEAETGTAAGTGALA